MVSIKAVLIFFLFRFVIVDRKPEASHSSYETMASITDAAARFERVVARLPAENITNSQVIKESLADPNKAVKCIWGELRAFRNELPTSADRIFK